MPPVAEPKHRTKVTETPTYRAVAAKAEAYMVRAKNYKLKLVEQRVPDALMGQGAAVSTAIAGGVLKGILGDKILSVPLDIPLALLGTAIAIPSALAGMPIGVHAGGGLVIPAVANLASIATRGAIKAVVDQTFGDVLSKWAEWKMAA